MTKSTHVALNGSEGGSRSARDLELLSALETIHGSLSARSEGVQCASRLLQQVSDLIVELKSAHFNTENNADNLEIFHRMSDLVASAKTQLDVNSSKMHQLLVEVNRAHAKTSEQEANVRRENDVILSCVTNLEDALTTRDGQIRELVKAVKFLRAQSTDLQGQLAMKQLEVQKIQTTLSRAQQDKLDLLRSQRPPPPPPQTPSHVQDRQEGELVEELNRKVKSLTSQLDKKTEIQKRQNARISQLESQNTKLSAEAQSKKTFTVDKRVISQLSEDIRHLKAENAGLKNPVQFADLDHNFYLLKEYNIANEGKKHAEAELKQALRKLDESQRETAVARKQLLLNNASLRQMEEQNRLLVERLRSITQSPGTRGGILRRTGNVPGGNNRHLSFRLTPDERPHSTDQLYSELDSARKENAKLKIKNAELKTSVEQLNARISQLKLTRPYSPSLDDAIGSIEVKQAPSSGKSAGELEVVIVKMKSVLDRILAENSRLKRNLAKKQSTEGVEHLRAENEQLTERLRQAELAAGATLAERRLQSEKALARLSIEYDKLRELLLKV
uniref:C2 domain-containing protein n=1 Tax=Mesocestoides corti TaxID=53468 RepID=A0A5K3FUP6_MESCO